MAHDPEPKDWSLYSYMPYNDRPKLHWPGGARVAFWLAPNIEFYELRPPMGAYHAHWQRPQPDIAHYSNCDYGNRVGVWRMFDLFARHDIRASVSLSAAVCNHYPEILQAGTELGWEWFSHGTYNTRQIYGLSPEQERALIRDSIETIRETTGQEMAGWLAPVLSNSFTIADSLATEGVRYTLDLFHDDQPMPVHVKEGRLISIPYSWVVNDSPSFSLWNLTPDAFELIVKRQFDQLYAEGADNPTVMCVPLHPYQIGQPNRIRALDNIIAYVKSHSDVWFPTAREIADHYYAHHCDRVVEAQRAAETEGARA